MPQGQDSSHSQRKPPSTIPDGLNGRELLWTRDQVTLRQFLDMYSYNLPKIVSVQNGYMGKDDLHTFATNEIYWICAVKTQQRIVAKEEGGYYVSIPVNYPLDVTVYPIEGKAHQVSLSEVAAMRNRSRDEFCIIFEDDQSVSFSMGADSSTKGHLGMLTVKDVYDERYLIGYPMTQGQVSLDYMVTIPAYVTITIALANGIHGVGKEEFVTMVDNMKRAITSLHMDYAINHDIILFPKNVTSNEYEYIDPETIVRRAPMKAPATKKPSKENPYVSTPHPMKKTGKEGSKRTGTAPAPVAVPGKPAIPGKPATVRGQVVANQMYGQSTNQGQVGVQGRATISTPSQAVLAAAGTEAARRASKRAILNMGQAHPASPAQPVSPSSPAQPVSPSYPAQPVSPSSPAPPVNEYARLTCNGPGQAQPVSPRSPALVSPGPLGHTTHRHPPTAHRDVKDMTVGEICTWMGRMNMSQHADVIVKNGVDGTLLQSLDEDILTREFGLSRFHAIKLLKFANEGYRPK
ncbi:hypothetical protein LSAT2_013124 [Lamellibrachia satsuma]|nr:hypothetical protein LSAT2_013124 [Lamellibrachia satsuma]